MNCTHKRALKILYRNNPGFKKIRFSSNQFKKERYDWVLYSSNYIVYNYKSRFMHYYIILSFHGNAKKS